MSTDDEPDLPATYAEVWGVRVRPTKGPKRGLTLEQIVAAGVAVASAEGLDAVSMSRLASELGLSAMALYRYVKSKDQLVDLMVDQALGTAMVEERSGKGGDWRARLEAWALAELAAYRVHPWALLVPIKGPSIAPNQVRWLELGLRCLRELKIEPYERISVILMVTNYTRSWASLSGSLQLALQSGDQDTLALHTHYAHFLRRLASREEFPALFEIVDSGIFEMADEEPDFDFAFGLARILDGIEAYAARNL